jgi:SAM-dependent methyltransferase
MTDHVAGAKAHSAPVAREFECCVCGPSGYEPFLEAVPDRLGVVPTASTYVRCKSCGLVALHPRPSFEETASFYPSSFWRTETADSERPSVAKRFETWFRERLIESEFAIIAEQLRPGIRHLDVGCATGDFIALCQARGTLSTGIELSESAVRHCREERGLDVIHGDLVDTDFGDRKFELITYNGVLEHVPDPHAHVRKCRTLLAPGGKLVILGLPNIESAGFRVAGKHWIGLDAPRHIHQFSGESLRALLSHAGFELKSIDFRSPRFNPPSLVASLFPPLHRHKFDAYEARTGKNPVLRKAALLAALQVARPLDGALCRLRLGEHLSCVAEVRASSANGA